MPTAVRELAGRWVRPVLVANLALQVAIVVTGGVVRLTDSGLGCPTWPECTAGSYVPTVEQAEGWHSEVEFGNRLLTFAVGLGAVAALLVVLLGRPGRPRLRLLAAAPLLGVVAQAVIGGVSVLLDLDPVVVAVHFLVSMVLIAVSALLLLRAGEGDAAPVLLVHPALRSMARVLAVVAAAVLVLGTVVTGAGPHSGDADPLARLPVDARTASWLHADAVLLFTGLAVGLFIALRATGAPARAVRAAGAVLAVTLGQGLVGYVQYALDLPEPLVALHMLGASLLVVVVTALLVSLRDRGPAPVGPPSGAPAGVRAAPPREAAPAA